jgi:hypothetical protein
MINVTGYNLIQKKSKSRLKSNLNCFGFASTHVLYCSLSRETVATLIVKHITKTYLAEQAIPPSSQDQKTNYCYFRCLSKPVISLEHYLNQLVKKGLCSQEALIMAVFLLGKLDAQQIDELTIHRLLLLCLVLSSKFWDDFYISNKNFAINGGVSVYELNKLEWSMMEMLEFNVWVSQIDFERTFTLILLHK